eukprot:TCONS_00006179-protein
MGTSRSGKLKKRLRPQEVSSKRKPTLTPYTTNLKEIPRKNTNIKITSKTNENDKNSTDNDESNNKEKGDSERYVDGLPLLDKPTEKSYEFEEKALRRIRINNVANVIIGHLNINSIRYRFEGLKLVIKDNVDIFLVSETKIDEPFPENHFIIENYSRPYRLDRDKQGGGLLLYVRQ